MTGRRVQCTMEVLPARPWQSKTFFVSNPMKISTNKGMRGVRARYDAVLPPNISIVRHPGRPVISGMEPGVYPYPLGAGSARPNPKKGAPKGRAETENPLFMGLTALRGGLRRWSQTMVSIRARPWGRGRSERFAEN